MRRCVALNDTAYAAVSLGERHERRARLTVCEAMTISQSCSQSMNHDPEPDRRVQTETHTVISPPAAAHRSHNTGRSNPHDYRLQFMCGCAIPIRAFANRDSRIHGRQTTLDIAEAHERLRQGHITPAARQSSSPGGQSRPRPCRRGRSADATPPHTEAAARPLRARATRSGRGGASRAPTAGRRGGPGRPASRRPPRRWRAGPARARAAWGRWPRPERASRRLREHRT